MNNDLNSDTISPKYPPVCPLHELTYQAWKLILFVPPLKATPNDPIDFGDAG